MDKNVRRSPFGANQQDRNPPVVSNQTKGEVNSQSNANNLNNPSSRPPKIKEGVPNTIGTSNIINSPADNTNAKEYEALKVFNCSKNFLRTTCDKLPANSIISKECSFPIGLIINPCSTFEGELPIVNYGETEIPRCYSSQCRAYINPFVKWIEGGDKWICNLCRNINTTESYYYGKLDKYGNRVDLAEKADLSCGSYEFLANKTYMKKDKSLSQSNFIFVIDVSLMSSQNGFLTAVLESIKDTINSDSIPFSERSKVAFITYDSSVHFYCLNKKLTQPQMLCVQDDNIFLPTTVESLVVDLGSSKKMALTALDLIQTSFNESTCKDSSKLFTAINAGYLLAKATGGKLLVFNASHSMTSLPKMKSSNIVNIPKDELIYSPTDEKQLSTMGINMTNENISCDLFIASETYVNLITLNQICDYTNGNLYLYKNFRLEAHYKNIFNQIRKCLTRFVCLEAVVRTRLSRGYKIGSFITPVLISNNDLLICSNLDSDQSFTVGLDVIDSESAGTGANAANSANNQYANEPYVYMQTAVLYSHQEGSRRIRIHNLCLPVASRLKDIYESIDAETLAAFYMKQTIDKIFKTKKISNSVLSTESAYKAFISSVISSQNMKKELPDNLAYLPLYVLGILKHRVCCKDELERKFDIDLSNYLRIKMQKLNYADVLSFIYPRIYPLHQILYDENIGHFDENGAVSLPQVISTYYSALESDGMYLIDNGYVLIFYTKFGVHSSLLRSVFDVDDLSKVSLPLFEDNVLSDPDGLKQRIVNIVDYIRGTKTLFQNLIFVFEGTDGERILKESLIEDNFCSWMTVDYRTFYTNTVEVGSSGYRPGQR